MTSNAIAERRAAPPATAGTAAPPSHMTPQIRPTAPGRRRRRSRKGATAAFLLVVALPTLIAALYYGLIASPLYISEAGVTIRTSKPQSASFLESLVTTGNTGAGDSETQLVIEYLRSRSALAEIEADVGFRRRYAVYDADFLSRLDPDAGAEATHDYYQHVLTVEDDGAGLLTVKARGFAAQDAKAVAEAAIRAAERTVNALSEKAQTDTLRIAEREVAKAEARLVDASDAVMAYQKSSGDLDPRRSAETVLGVIAGLETELAGARISRAETRSRFRADSPAIRALDSRIDALRRQLAEARGRLAASNDATLAEQVRAFESERLQLELAETAFKSALASQEAARITAQNDRSYLVAFATPSLPDVPAEPRRLYMILTTCVVSLLVFGVGSLIVGAIREHARA